jgi:formiminotetrahydrofolate cyclodeaminase
MLTTKTVSEFLDEVASNSPAPGGGSVSALAGSLGAALTSMVCRLTIGKKKYADVHTEMEDTLKKSEALRANLTAVIDEDTQAFNKVMAAFGMPKETEVQKEQRSKAVQEATKFATLVPLRLMSLCEEGVALSRIVAERGNKNSLSDAGVALLLLQTAAKGGELNVRINLAGLEDKRFVDEMGTEATERMKRIDSTIRELIPPLIAHL